MLRVLSPAAMPLELEGEQWWAVATLSPETFRNYFSRLDLLGEGRLEVYRYDGVPLFAYGSGQWLTTVERQDRFGVQLAAREIGPAAERLRLGEPVLESYRAARRMPVVVVAAENRARVLADWRSNLQMSLWVFLPLLAGLLAATLMMVRQRFSAIRSMEARTQAEVSRLAQLDRQPAGCGGGAGGAAGFRCMAIRNGAVLPASSTTMTACCRCIVLARGSPGDGKLAGQAVVGIAGQPDGRPSRRTQPV